MHSKNDMPQQNDAVLIPKEDIPQYHFVSFDVLENETEREQRSVDLQKAMLLGNTDHVKIKLYFQTTEGLKEVETTVWAFTDSQVVLKSGTNVPVHSISKVEFV